MRVFVPHTHEEHEIANAIKRQFDAVFGAMVDVFLSEDIKLGADWLEEIKNALQAADIILVLFSPASQSRPWINIEAGYGIMAGKSVIPICCLGLAKSKLPVVYVLRQGLELADRADTLKLLETIAAATPARRLMVGDKTAAVDSWVDAMSAAAAKVPPYTASSDSPVTVWIMGSVNEVDHECRDRAFKTADALAEAFIARGYRVLLGRNLLLNYLADRVAAGQIDQAQTGPGDIPQLLATKSARSKGGAPNPLILLGSLRPAHGLRRMFIDSVGIVPDIGLVIGGAPSGRALEEAQLAMQAGIPVLPLPFTGGAAEHIEASFDTSLSEDVRAVQAMSRGSDVLGNRVCELIERQVSLTRGVASRTAS